MEQKLLRIGYPYSVPKDKEIIVIRQAEGLWIKYILRFDVSLAVEIHNFILWIKTPYFLAGGWHLSTPVRRPIWLLSVCVEVPDHNLPQFWRLLLARKIRQLLEYIVTLVFRCQANVTLDLLINKLDEANSS
jgi:hypothetical protein